MVKKYLEEGYRCRVKDVRLRFGMMLYKKFRIVLDGGFMFFMEWYYNRFK